MVAEANALYSLGRRGGRHLRSRCSAEHDKLLINVWRCVREPGVPAEHRREQTDGHAGQYHVATVT